MGHRQEFSSQHGGITTEPLASEPHITDPAIEHQTGIDGTSPTQGMTEAIREHAPDKEQVQQYGKKMIEAAKNSWHTIQEKTPDVIKRNKARTAAIGIGSFTAARMISSYKNRNMEVTLPVRARTARMITSAPRRAMTGTREYIHRKTA